MRWCAVLLATSLLAAPGQARAQSVVNYPTGTGQYLVGSTGLAVGGT